jgi:hypothetical protein
MNLNPTTSSKPPYDSDNSEEIQNYNNKKQAADKIRQILSQVRNNASDSARRWIWELIQNAKDIPTDADRRRTMKVDYDGQTVVFSHNAKPFSMYNLNSLVQQVSSKNSTNDEKKVTGKFGTGFIATHLLSPIIHVEGPVQFSTGEVKKVTIKLDRSGDSSEELMVKISDALDLLKDTNNEEVFATADYSDKLTDKTYLGTSFTYPLYNAAAISAAEDGLSDIPATLPIALIGNADLIEKIVVCDRGKETIYSVSDPKDEGHNVQSAMITINNADEPDTYLSFLFTKNEEEGTTRLFVPVESNGPTRLSKKPKTTPFLYRDFPLIGSEDFHFPFIINGSDLNPTENRANIILHSEEDKDAVKNRQQIEEAFKLAEAFTRSLIALNIDARFRMAYTRLPHQVWKESKETGKWSSKRWYTNLQQKLRATLFELPIVLCGDGVYRSLSQVRLPKFGQSTTDNERFYDIAQKMLGNHSVPDKSEFLQWQKVLGPENEYNWPSEIDYGLEDLFEGVHACKSLNQLTEKLTGTDDTINWLKGLYQFTHEHHKSQLFKEYAALPTIQGELKKQVEGLLFKQDSQDQLPDFFLDRLQEVDASGTFNWRNYVVDRRLTSLPFLEASRGLTTLSAELNKVLKTKTSANSDFNDSFLEKDEEGRKMIFTLLKAKTAQQTEESSRFKLLSHLTELYNEADERVEVQNIQGFTFDMAEKIAVRFANQKIQNAINVTGVAALLKTHEPAAMVWLNTYYSLLKSSSNLLLEIDKGRIFPDVKGEFHKWEDLENPGADDARLPIELIDILGKLNPRQSWHRDLLSYDVKIRRTNTKTFVQLSAALRTEVLSVQEEYKNGNSQILDQKAEPLSSLIDWCEDEQELAKTYLSSFEQNRISLSFALTVGNKGIKVKDIRLLGKEGTIDILRTLDKSSLSNEQAQQLFNTVNAANFNSIMRQAVEIKAEADHKVKMLKMGQDIEVVIQDALNKQASGLKASRPTAGKGPYDILVKNEATGASCRIEVKSHASHKGQSLRFAPPQAKAAIANDDNYVISLIPIEDYSKEVPKEYIAANLLSCVKVGHLFEEGYQDFKSHEAIRTREGISTLYIQILGDERIQVAGDELRKEAMSMTQLIKYLHQTIG